MRYKNYFDNIFCEIGLKNRFFIEAGANDGVSQSNTSYLESDGWRGLLIEPNIENFTRCRQNRPNSYCINAALISDSYTSSTVKGIFSSESLNRDNGLMSGCTDEHLNLYPNWVCEVPAITLTDCLIQSNSPANPDFFSLDVEGFEIEALNGLDFNRFRPRVIFLEISKWFEIDYLNNQIEFLKNRGYEFHSNPGGFNPILQSISENYSQEGNFTFIDKHN